MSSARTYKKVEKTAVSVLRRCHFNFTIHIFASLTKLLHRTLSFFVNYMSRESLKRRRAGFARLLEHQKGSRVLTFSFLPTWCTQLRSNRSLRVAANRRYAQIVVMNSMSLWKNCTNSSLFQSSHWCSTTTMKCTLEGCAPAFDWGQRVETWLVVWVELGMGRVWGI